MTSNLSKAYLGIAVLILVAVAILVGVGYTRANVFAVSQTYVLGYGESADIRLPNGETWSISCQQPISSPVPTPSAPAPARISTNLYALYTFMTGSGDTVYDVSGRGDPLDLTCNRITWIPGGGVQLGDSIVGSDGPATKILEGISESEEITVEAWISPHNVTQDGPARIMSISDGAYRRNFTLGQGLWGGRPGALIDVRLRTTDTSLNGMPSLSTEHGSLGTGLTHVAYTRNSAGQARIYLNGVERARGTVSGTMSNWEADYRLVLGNETSEDRPWSGNLYLVAIYNRDLSQEEIQHNYQAGLGYSPVEAPTATPTPTPSRLLQPAPTSPVPPTPTGTLTPTKMSASTPTRGRISPRTPTATSTFIKSQDPKDCDRIISPGQSLQGAINALQPGDTLCLRGGTYTQSDITIAADGTAGRPITIQSYPGERAQISDMLDDLTWTLVDRSIGLYQSDQTVPSDGHYGGWLADQEIQLLPYEDFNRLKSTKYSGMGAYVGPGIHVTGGKVYVRLQQNPNHLVDHEGNSIAAVPSNTDPNHNRIHIFHGKHVFLLSGANHLIFSDLDIGPSHYVFGVDSRTHNIRVTQSTIRLKSYGFTVSEGSSGLEIDNNIFRMGFPEWIYWGDVKSGDKPAYGAGWNSFAINGSLQNTSIHHNEFIDCFDGIFINTGSRNVTVQNNYFFRCRDDAINLRPGARNVDIARNVIRHCYEGISVVGGSSTDSGVTIHHNVIDITRHFRKYRLGTWETGHVWGNHTCSNGCDVRWEIYNNTIIGKDVVLDRYTNPWSQGAFVNNLIIAIGPATRPGLNPAHGNIWWRSVDSRASDPGIDLDAVQAHTYDSGTVWDVYRPTNGVIFSPGHEYTSDIGWSGTAGVAYRGAVGP